MQAVATTLNRGACTSGKIGALDQRHSTYMYWKICVYREKSSVTELSTSPWHWGLENARMMEMAAPDSRWPAKTLSEI